ncbi:MAG: hypothetical protein ACRECY_07970 [Phyllobacterium sp.]
MKNILLATAIALSSVVAFSGASQAASTVTTIRKVEHHRPMMHNRHRHQDCYVKKTKHRSHGRVVVEKTRICR